VGKPKAPRELTEAFVAGVDAREYERVTRSGAAYSGAWAACWLAQFDQTMAPCGGRNLGVNSNLERMHLIPRQRVEEAIWAMLPYQPVNVFDPESIFDPRLDKWAIIHAAAWDDRNGAIGCEHHHRRFDRHSTPSLVVPRAAVPLHLSEFVFDYFGLGAWEDLAWLADRFPR